MLDIGFAIQFIRPRGIKCRKVFFILPDGKILKGKKQKEDQQMSGHIGVVFDNFDLFVWNEPYFADLLFGLVFFEGLVPSYKLK